MTTRHKAICRVCVNFCGVEVEVDDGRVVAVHGDSDNPAFRGYRCTKGALQGNLYRHPDRLLHSLKRNADGSFSRIASEDACAEIAERLRPLLDEHGPRALAMYWGTYFGFDNSVNTAVADSFMRSVGSPMTFTPVTIDQPGRQITKALHGLWLGGDQSLLAPEVALVIGGNPIVSHQGRSGSPAHWLRDLRDWGTELIVIDPRRTETAARAALHLQPRPGEDVSVLAGMLRVIFAEGLEDREFLDEHVTGVEELRAAVEPWTPEAVAERADVPADDLVRAARIWGRAKRGYGWAGTGMNMSGHGTLGEYLLACLHTVRGFWAREGDPVPAAYSLLPPQLQPTIAQAMPPFPVNDPSQPMRVRGLSQSMCGMPTAALADEILTEGKGKVRALFSLGGAPVNGLPDQKRTVEAFRALDLLVHSDIQMSATAKLSDYVIAVKLPLEMACTTLLSDFLGQFAIGWGHRQSYAQYQEPVVDPPAGSDLLEQWELIYEVARHLGVQLEVAAGLGELMSAGDPTPVDMAQRPTVEAMMEVVHAGGRVSLDELRKHPSGMVFDHGVTIAPKMPGYEGRLDVGNADMVADLGALAPGPEVADASFPFRLICRRAAHTMNAPALAYPDNRPRHNPAYMHPDDLASLVIAPGDRIEIRSQRAAVIAVAAGDDTVRPGVVSIHHSFGDLPDSDETRLGVAPALLIDVEDMYDRYSGQPRMSSVPVAVSASICD